MHDMVEQLRRMLLFKNVGLRCEEFGPERFLNFVDNYAGKLRSTHRLKSLQNCLLWRQFSRFLCMRINVGRSQIFWIVFRASYAADLINSLALSK